jgi:hypothetical protein
MTSSISMFSNFLAPEVFSSLQQASVNAPPAVDFLHEHQLDDLKDMARSKFPDLQFEHSDCEWRLGRPADLAKSVAICEAKIRAWRREITAVQQTASFDNAIVSLRQEIKMTKRVHDSRGSRRIVRQRLSAAIQDDEDDQFEEDFEEPEEPEVVPPPLIVTNTDYVTTGPDQWRCSICLESNEDQVVEPGCGHPYHHHCLMGYIASSARDGTYRCAVCRQSLSAMEAPTEVEFLETAVSIMDESEVFAEAEDDPNPSDNESTHSYISTGSTGSLARAVAGARLEGVHFV